MKVFQFFDCFIGCCKVNHYPLILHPLLIIRELARNYPLIIRSLSYTKSKKT